MHYFVKEVRDRLVFTIGSDKKASARLIRYTEILELYLQCHSQQEIANKLEVTQKTISNVLSSFSTTGDFTNNIPDNLQLYNIWNIGRLEIDDNTVGRIISSHISINGKKGQPDNLQLYNIWNIGHT